MIVDLSVASWNYIKIVKMVQPTIELLRDQIRETIVMGALIRNRILIMTSAEAVDPLKISVTPGTSLPPLAGAAGKVLHASKPREQMKRFIRETGLPRYTPRSIADEEEYLDELEQVHLKNYSVDHEEFIAGVSAVAMALNNPIGPPMAIWAVGLSSSLMADKKDNAIRTLLGVSKKLRDTVKQASGY
jgi:IclR family acetate operon transcriptional repressor